MSKPYIRNIPNSCPEFDEAIGYIESARKINAILRDAMDAWEAYAEELEEQITEMESDHKTEVKALEDEIRELREQVPA